MIPSDPEFPVHIPLSGNDIQARVVPGSEREGGTGIYRNAAFPELVTPNSKPEYPKTVFEIFNRALRLRPKRALFGWRATVRETGELANEHSWVDHVTSDMKRRWIGSGLMHLARSGVIDTAGKETGWVIAK